MKKYLTKYLKYTLIFVYLSTGIQVAAAATPIPANTTSDWNWGGYEGNDAEQLQKLLGDDFKPVNLEDQVLAYLAGEITISKDSSAYIGMQQAIQTMYECPVLIINGKEIPFSSKHPVVLKGTTYVPLRLVSEYVGAKVTYTNSTSPIVISKDGKSISINQTDCKRDHKNTYVPLRIVSESIGLKVDFDIPSNIITITG